MMFDLSGIRLAQFSDGAAILAVLCPVYRVSNDQIAELLGNQKQGYLANAT
jgi:hypothetical protein